MNTVEGLILQAYDRLKAMDAAEALHLLQEALKIEFDNPEVKYGLKCVRWWLERVERLNDFHTPYEKGEFVISQWKSFHAFLDQIGDANDACLYAVRRFVFTLALGFFEAMLAAAGSVPDPELLFQIGRCYKGVGNYEEAVKFLEQAVRFRQDDSAALAELADVNALLGDPRAAKVLFREAFYLDPQAVDLWSMESEMIIRLRQKVAELGHSGRDLAEWIPVYGTLWGVFSVRRELKPVELGKLKQSILALESESGSKPKDIQKPRLLNRYFRLIDHCGLFRSGNTRDSSELVEETMRKIKLIDPAIHEQYRN